MTIKMLAGFAGSDFSVSPGDITDRFSEGEEGRMIEAGFAEAVEPVNLVETEEPATPARKSRKAS